METQKPNPEQITFKKTETKETQADNSQFSLLVEKYTGAFSFFHEKQPLSLGKRIFEEKSPEALGKKITPDQAKEIAAAMDRSSKLDTRLNDSQAEEAIEFIVNEKPSAKTSKKLNSLVTWAQQSPEKVRSLQRLVAMNLEKSKKLNLPTLALLAKTDKYEDSAFVEEELVVALETNVAEPLPSSLAEEVSVLATDKNQEANLLNHQVLDFVGKYITTIQDHSITDRDKREYDFLPTGFAHKFVNFSERQKDLCPNYLVCSHFQDIVESVDQFNSKKTDAVEGNPGGHLDSVIYSYQKLEESYQNRLALGLKSGYPLSNPTIKIAPGLVAEYKNGIPAKFYPEPDKSYKEVEKELAQDNNPEFDYIYEILNSEQAPSLAERNLADRNKNEENARMAWQLKRIWSFLEKVDEADETFYFDTSQLDMEKIPRIVKGSILTHNQEIFAKNVTGPEWAQPLSEKQLEQKVFPLSEFDEKQEYLFKYMQSLQIRKKIEDGFGIKIEELGLWEQRNLLSFLEETNNVERVEELRNFTNEFGNEGLRTFTALEANPEIGADILTLAKLSTPEKMKKVVKAFNAIVDRTSQIESYLEKSLKHRSIKDRATILKIKQNLLARGAKLIEAATREEKQKQPSLTSELEDANSEILLFFDTFKSLEEMTVEDFKETSWDKMPGKEIEKEDKQAMMQIAIDNWANFKDVTPELRKMVLDDIEEALEKDNNEFNILRYQGKIIGYLRFDKISDTEIYAGSLNIKTTGRGGRLGRTLLKMLLEAKDDKIQRAVSTTKLRIFQRYIGEFGFIGTGIMSNYHETGEPIVSLERDKNETNKYDFFKAPTDEIKKAWGGTNDFTKTDEKVVMRFDASRGQADVNSGIEEVMQGEDGDWRLTAFRYDPQDRNQVYVGFEKKK